MGRATASAVGGRTGRSSSALLEDLRGRVAAGEVAAGQFLPSQRALMKQSGLAQNTVRRALKKLEDEGLVRAEPGKGYRVLAKAADPDRGVAIAYIPHAAASEEAWDDFHELLGASLQQLAGRMGWSLLVTVAEESGCAELVERLRSMGAFGAILESFDRRILDELHSAGLPAVVVDALSMDVEADVVLQDGEMGAMRAAEHLAGLGHRKIGWIGPELRNGNPQVIDRFCGAVGGLVRHGLSIPEKLRVSIPLDDRDEARRRARALLSRKDRPDAVLALWQKATEAVVWAARDLGLTPGKDFGMVGWATKKYYFDRYVPLFQGGPVPPAVVWSLFDMTRAAIRCLTMRRKEPKMPPLQIRVPARLWFYGTPPAV